MSKWKNYLAKAVNKIDTGVDKVHYKLADRFSKDAIVALPYVSYGTKEKFYIKGRVLEAKSVQPAREDASFWENFKNAYKRFESDEVPQAKVKISFNNTEKQLEADNEGYFETHLELKEPLTNKHAYAHTISVELLAPIRDKQEDKFFQGKVITPSDDAAFGIISDIDDTVLQTGATSVLSMAKKVLFGNAKTRLPFEGVADFYQALHKNKNPLFYVSSSPWNLYDVLLEFLDINDIPAGPLMLRDWGTSASELLPTSHGTHKLDVIKQILDTYPKLPFILIGDSGQEDPEIYTEIVRAYPKRILSIYIRDVSEGEKRDQAIAKLAKEVAEHATELVLVADTLAAYTHANKKGWISKSAPVG